MLQKEEIALVFYVVMVIAILLGFVIIFFITFQRKKTQLLEKQFEAEKRFVREIEESSVEIQEQTLKNIAWELHDNIGQLLSVTNMQLHMLASKLDAQNAAHVNDVSTSVKHIVQEVRLLSKSLNSEVIFKNGLVSSIKFDLQRFKRLNFLETSLTVHGEEKPIDRNVQIIIFRIFQEFTTNVFKHAQAKNLTAIVAFNDQSIELTVKDDGRGFDTTKTTTSNGLQHMHSRAQLIKAQLKLTSSIGNGTNLYLQCPLNNTSNA